MKKKLLILNSLLACSILLQPLIGANGVLNITAIKSIKTYEGFKVSNGGIGNFKCLENINMEGGNVGNGSVLKLSGENVLLSNDFSVNLGGELNISY